MMCVSSPNVGPNILYFTLIFRELLTWANNVQSWELYIDMVLIVSEPPLWYYFIGSCHFIYFFLNNDLLNCLIFAKSSYRKQYEIMKIMLLFSG